LGVEELANYCEFIENGNEQLCKVCKMCSDLFIDTVTENSFDIEQNLRNIAVYFDKLHFHDTLVGTVIEKSDTWIKTNENTVDKKEQVKQVRKIRDEILMRDICNAAFTNNHNKINTYNSKVIYNVEEVISNVFDVSSANELYSDDGFSFSGENKPDDIPGDVSAVKPNVSSHILEAYNNGVSEINNFKETGNVSSFVDAINSFNVVQSQVAYDAAGDVLQAHENNKDVGLSGMLPYRGSFIYRDKNVIESFYVIRNMDNFHNIFNQAFTDINTVSNNEVYMGIPDQNIIVWMTKYLD